MGFRVPRKTARLHFEGDEYEGMLIEVALDITFKEQQHIQDLREKSEGAKGDEADEINAAIMDYLATKIVTKWNIEDDEGNELPVTGESFMDFPAWFAMKVMNGWAQAMKQLSDVDAPLEPPSPNGSLSEEQSAEMAAASKPLQS